MWAVSTVLDFDGRLICPRPSMRGMGADGKGKRDIRAAALLLQRDMPADDGHLPAGRSNAPTATIPMPYDIGCSTLRRE
jgi:hypothetical protein